MSTEDGADVTSRASTLETGRRLFSPPLPPEPARLGKSRTRTIADGRSLIAPWGDWGTRPRSLQRDDGESANHRRGDPVAKAPP